MNLSFFYKKLPVLLIILLLTGLLWSRALLSITQGIAFIYGIAVWIKQSNHRPTLPLLWGSIPVLLFFLGVYQLHSFNREGFDYLITLLTYPAAFFFLWTVTAEQRSQVLIIWVSFAIISCLYPLGWYVTHLTEAQLRYASGKTLPTFMQDHVRYGLFLSSGLLILLYEKLFAPKLQIVLSIFLAFCLVILSVRTAWVALLILAIIWISSKSRRFVLPLGIAALLLICLAAYQFLPTVQQKINYIRWDWESYKVNNYQPDFSDGTRRVINQISWELIYQKKQSNLGWSRVAPTLQTEITNRFPAATVTYGWPFNQYLFWWMGAGIIGLLLFSSWLLSPVIFFFNNKPVFSWTLVFAASCLVESTLNLQYGVFLHAWLMALFALSKKAE